MAVTRRGLVLSCGAAALAGCAIHPAPAGDAYPFWKITKGGGDIFLIGDCGSPTDPWRSPRIEAAFASSKVFWKETADMHPEDAAKFAAHGMSPAETLSARLTPEQKQKVEAAAAKVGVAFSSLEAMQPWLAAGFLNSRTASQQGALASPLPVLSMAAESTGKPIRTEFASSEVLIDWFVAMPADAQVEYLLSTADIIIAGDASWPQRQAAWASGRLDMEELRIAKLMRGYPKAYEAETASRNRQWLPRFGTMLAEKSPTFVLVGSAHLVGPQGLLALLKQAGTPPQRI